MARLLGCPYCRADFTFDDWARGTACPACGQRLSFFEASGQAAPAPAPAGQAVSWGQAASAAPASVPAPLVAAVPPVAAVPAPAVVAAAPVAAAARLVAAAPAPVDAPVAPPPAAAMPWDAAPIVVAAAPAAASLPHAPHVYTMGGKALRWSTGWTVVLVIWAVVAVGLVATRVEMGPVTVMTPAETAAIAAARAVKLPTGASTETVLRYSATHDLTLEGHVATIPAGGTEMWYAFDRPWEHRIYVYTELPGASLVGKNADLTWTVADGVATPDGATRAALTKAAQTMAHPPSPNSVRPIPGIIPSLPPDLQ